MDSFRIIKDDLESQRIKAIKTAQDLLYSNEIIERLRKATSTMEIDRILHTARKGNIVKSDKLQDKSIFAEKKPVKKPKPVSKPKMPHMLACPCCGKNTAEDYYVVTVLRVKQGIPYYSRYQTIWCPDCYDDIYRANVERKEKNDAGN